MYAKLLFQHNNMGGPSVGLFGSKISLGEPRIFDRRKYFSQLYLQAKMSAGKHDKVWMICAVMNFNLNIATNS